MPGKSKNPPNCICKTCSAPFFEFPSRIKDNRGLYCSKKCFYGHTWDESGFWSGFERDKSTGCLLWTRARDKRGYGVASGPKRNWIHSHRLVWILKHGPLDSKIFVCHKCDNPPCGEIGHLFSGTCKDNMADCANKGRMSKGEHRALSKLTEKDIPIIKQKYSNGETLVSLGKIYGVHFSTISSVVNGDTWKHVKRVHSPTPPNTQDQLVGLSADGLRCFRLVEQP